MKVGLNVFNDKLYQLTEMIRIPKRLREHPLVLIVNQAFRTLIASLPGWETPHPLRKSVIHSFSRTLAQSSSLPTL
jgi:hypothetical protein